MTTRDAGAGRGAKGPDELRREIEQTRHDLGDTVEELAGKLDVKGRAKARAEDWRDKAGAMGVQLRSSASQASRPVMIAGVAAGAVVAAGVAMRRHGGHQKPPAHRWYARHR
ncbi:DUF3618 domain-containing protein [Streptomyces sp. SBST2-5]|uniref:DUF3618 domain-containing protein n=1 Tax=Streptomyces composti TaxID=2720025 RepID=A0ABX1A6F7_9ACTN|nr:DUF3618 domain-containing protein [Streptomyces composti]NJP49438.1 DUF3618 domain-containing protein [Streptomyces composti]